MKRNILILNGDSSSNIGDGAILLGNIELLKTLFPGSPIRAFSMFPERDTQWYGIFFYKKSMLTERLKAYFWANLVIWGGGELIQDDTSRLKIPYWFMRIMLLSLVFRKKIIALGQGLGPVGNRQGKALTKLMANRLALYFSRDNYSEGMLRALGATIPIISSLDPAILVSNSVVAGEASLVQYLHAKNFDISDKDRIVGVGVRRWFHHTGSWIPHKYAHKYKLRKIPGEAKYQLMKGTLAFLLDELSTKHQFKIVFFPMYPPEHEADDKVSIEIAGLMKNKGDTFVIQEKFSPQQYANLMKDTFLFFGTRLHSTILSSSVGVPSLTFYYVPKGKSYFEQLGTPENAFPVECLLSREKTLDSLRQFENVIDNHEKYREKISASIEKMKMRLMLDAEKIHRYI